ncbi:glycosyltransferase family 2 protein [Thioalkalicoccus limnaeus]|uniref:Glycosyltransferase family 2 protein n=1 Tax=Thioalkalicoccus limnaeus TaxID=120681 RepID=A0ABV4BG58_9GAMM
MSTLSVIIPTRALGPHLDQLLASCRDCLPDAERILVVADLGSAQIEREMDATRWLDGQTRILYGPPGRGPQCNLGARAARGDLLFFLHDDSRLPIDAWTLIERLFVEHGVHLACFRLRFDDPHWLLAVYGWFSRFDSLLTSFGDQGILVRRSLFDALGGFPDWPLFEDVDFLRRARRATSIRKLPATITTSAARYLARGRVRQQLFNGWLILLYLLGTAPGRLAAAYERRR